MTISLFIFAILSYFYEKCKLFFRKSKKYFFFLEFFRHFVCIVRKRRINFPFFALRIPTAA